MLNEDFFNICDVVCFSHHHKMHSRLSDLTVLFFSRCSVWMVLVSACISAHLLWSSARLVLGPRSRTARAPSRPSPAPRRRGWPPRWRLLLSRGPPGPRPTTRWSPSGPGSSHSCSNCCGGSTRFRGFSWTSLTHFSSFSFQTLTALNILCWMLWTDRHAGRQIDR